MTCGNGKRLFAAAAVIGWFGISAPAFALDSAHGLSTARNGRVFYGARLVETGQAAEHRSEPPSRYTIDPLHYNERWTSMFGSKVSVSERVSLFVDYQYDQWAPSSSDGASAFRAWKNYRVTVGCTITY